MQNNYFLSIVLPVYNEEKKLERDIGIIFDHFLKQPYSFEMIVVNDGSSDQTLQKAERLKAKHKNLKVISYERNRGKGYAVKTGILETQGDYVLFADAGGCVAYSELEKGLTLLQNGSDIAIASRALPDSELVLKNRWYRTLGGNLFWILIRFFLGIKGLRDTQCGFKIFRREPAQKIFSLQRIEGFMFDVEWILNAQKFGYKIQEFPVRWICDRDSRFHPFPGAFRVLFDLIRIKLHRRRK